MKDHFLAQLEREAASTRKTLERVPEGRGDWKPHEKSMTLGYLASLVASMPGWISFMIDRDEFCLNDPSSAEFKTRTLATRAELINQLDESVARARKALQGATDEHLLKRWKLKTGDRVLSDEQRQAVIADSFSHLAHHRGQLTVYLRLNNASVPAIYGPSADEH